MICVIIAGGECGKVHIPPDAFVIAADSGYARCMEQGIAPHLVIGDFDSLGYVPDGKNVVTVPVRKDDTDMMLAVKAGFDRGCGEFLLYGGTGGRRLSHTMANIQTLSYIRSRGGTGTLFFEGGYACILAAGEHRPKVYPGGYISLFALSDTAQVSLSGFAYEGDVTLERHFPLGVSNVPLTDAPLVKVHSGEVLAVAEERDGTQSR